MSITVLETLKNAKFNFDIFKTIGKIDADNNPTFMIAMEQLTNAVTALSNGKNPIDVIQEHIGDNVDVGA